ncbi:lipoate--protein ligase [Faecalicatena contorta]|uniref:lipoate--protein ligase n=1 Tax=Faecalicatena contorta TaxID=39482 RepID=UPI001F21F2E7|nr:lipoate--protein ligase [Faecalicatena contorta]MCF2682394.1 lipoate--protein ligase [Faecalicatena contorta]
MIEKITYIETANTYPYRNLAMEEYLLLHCDKEECILYLWQNRNTVVIGRNQNAWKECLVSKLEEENGYPVRRLSGGGAVYHDLGNLNFTFLVRKENYDVDRQLNVILEAVKKLGIHAEKSGRNDILIDGHKFSGNAFYEQGDCCYHHGTLMVNVNLGELSRYLTVSKDKLKSKGVDSVRARVANLTEYAPDLTVDELKKKLLEAFEEVYGLKANILKDTELDADEVEERTQKFASWNWIFGRKLEFQYELSNRFPWGQVTLQMQVRNGRIKDVNVYSDSMKPAFIEEVSRYLKSVRYDKKAICAELSLYWSKDQEEDQMMKDIIAWIESIDL